MLVSLQGFAPYSALCFLYNSGIGTGKATEPDKEEFSRMIETARTGGMGSEIDPDIP